MICGGYITNKMRTPVFSIVCKDWNRLISECSEFHDEASTEFANFKRKSGRRVVATIIIIKKDALNSFVATFYDAVD